MIPRAITLQNFLSYGSTPQTISFDSYNLICLSGKNGHGKSALLDAITWAVWGQARKTVGTNKPDDGLLRLGSRQMVVVFECEVNGQQYRIRREYSKGQGKAQANLDVGVYDAQMEEYRSLTDKTIRRTQAVIEDLIGLDYETYVNSAFLRQGHANEFSQKSPKERKKILATILGVNRFDGLQSFALEKARECAQQIRVLHELQAQDEQILATHDELTVQYKQYEIEQGQIEKKNNDLVQQFTNAQRAVEQYNARQEEHASRQKELEESQESIRLRRQKWFENAQQWRANTAQLRSGDGGMASMKELQELRKKEQEMRTAQLAQVTAQQELVATEKKMLTRQRELEQLQQKTREEKVQQVHTAQAGFEQARTQVQHVQMQHDQCVVEYAQVTAQQKEMFAQITDQQKKITQHAQAKKQFDKRRAFYAAYVPRAKWLYQQQDELKKKGELVNHKQSSSCPLCEQILSAKRKHFLHDKLRDEQRQVAHQYERLHRVLGALKAQLVNDHELVKEYEGAVAQTQTLQGQVEQTTMRITQLAAQLSVQKKELNVVDKKEKEAAQKLTKVKRDVEIFETAVRVQTQEDEQLQTLAVKIGELSMQQKKQQYDNQVHAALEQKINALEKTRTDVEQLREKAGALKEQRVALSTQRILLKKDHAVLQKRATDLLKAGLNPALKKELDTALAVVVKTQDEERANKERIVSLLSTVKTKLEQVAQRRVIFGKRSKEIAKHEETKSDYSMLATAWSKNGIQALLIEQAIPEIEQEANELLSRLSQNQAQVFIESQRDLKGGGVRETLDIKISDTMGVRPYEMFSGGEAFRIDFALRIAISKLLARRAGTALQVLIIDEGFGSQDEEGLQRLMQALYTVQEDFEKIIVVSHLAEFKENFPVHFVVNKGATGSQITIEQRG